MAAGLAGDDGVFRAAAAGVRHQVKHRIVRSPRTVWIAGTVPAYGFTAPGGSLRFDWAFVNGNPASFAKTGAPWAV